MVQPSIVPRPATSQLTGGAFELGAATTVLTGTDCAGVARLLAQRLRASSGFDIPIVEDDDAHHGGTISLAVDRSLDAGAYTVDVDPEGVRLVGGDPAGVFWASQVLLQLCPPAVFRTTPIPGTDWSVPCVEITDRPRFGWRGMLIDLSRHFFGRDSLLKLIDVLALHRMNVLHLHLTDDQGWRMEIRKYPRLTEIGSWRSHSVIDNEYVRAPGAEPVRDLAPHSGYLTQDDLREIVAYAGERFITVVPEVDLPGHSQAVIASYPRLGNTTEQLDVWTDWGVSPHVLNVEDATIDFCRDVLDEVMDVFPGEFVHIGGDEVPKDEWRASASAQERIAALGLADEEALQGWFAGRLGAHLAARGRRMVGWDELLDGAPPEGATIMSWRGESGGVAAAEAGHDVVMTPDEPTYLYHRQSEDRGSEPAGAEPLITLQEVFDYDPLPRGLSALARDHVLGAQCQMWTEFVSSERQLHQMVFPRLCAFAEAVWRTRPTEFDDFVARLEPHRERLHAMGIDGYRERPGVGARTRPPSNGEAD